MLAEEAVGIAITGLSAHSVLEGRDTLALMAAEPSRNMDADEKAYEVQDSLDALPRLMPALTDLSKARAEALLADHTRVRDASRQRGLAYSVEPCLSADVIGCFVLMPA